jgi:hypothetical protein
MEGRCASCCLFFFSSARSLILRDPTSAVEGDCIGEVSASAICRNAMNVSNDCCPDDDIHYFEEDKWMLCHARHLVHYRYRPHYTNIRS